MACVTCASADPDDASAYPVRRAGATVPDAAGHGVLLGLRGQVGRRAGPAEQLPGTREDLVVARGTRAVRREVLAARLAQDDRVGDGPAAARSEGRAGGGRRATRSGGRRR